MVRQAQAGDRGAFEALARGEIDHLYATATLILHDPTLGQDAVQETLIRAWHGLPRLRDAERFDGWLRRVLVHACIDAARSARHDRQVRELPIELGDGTDLEARVVEQDAVERAFSRLSPEHRAAFVLRHFDDRSVAEVAEALHVPLGTAKSRLHYAEAAMAKAMEADTTWAPVGGAA
jgi:RNA polymerase sigma-70 factor (ECF subfamily)